MAKKTFTEKVLELWNQELGQIISESRQKVALEFLNLDEDTDASQVFALKYAENDPESHVATDVASFMKGDIKKLGELQREFRADVFDIINCELSNKDVTPLYRVAEKLCRYTENIIPEWQIDFTDEHNPQLIEELPPEKKFPAMLYGWLIHDIIEEGRTLKVCAAEGCGKIFIPKLKRQIYHSDKCRKRIWARKNKK